MGNSINTKKMQTHDYEICYNTAMNNGYQINEKDIDGVLNYLKIHDPSYARNGDSSA